MRTAAALLIERFAVLCLWACLTGCKLTAIGPMASATSASGAALSALANPASAPHVLASYEAYDSDGNRVTGTMSNRGTWNMNATPFPGTGYYSALVSTLTPTNVCSGTQIFGAAGAAICQSGSTIAPAVAASILSGQEAWDASGTKMTGSMTNRGAFDAASSFPGAGYYNGTVNNAPSAARICSGTTILGAAGTANCISGAFQTRVNTATSESGARGIVVRDVDRDGKLDLLINETNTGRLVFHKGVGNGTFQAGVVTTTWAQSTGYRNLALADFNKDGREDAILCDSNNNRIGLLAGNGNGTFQAATFTGGAMQPNEIVVGDFNRDGRMDFAVGASAFPNWGVQTYFGDGAGAFAAPTLLATAGANIRGVATGDVDGDGNLDIAVGADNSVEVFLGSATGTFGARTAYSFGGGIWPLPSLLDVDSDGDLDLVSGGTNVAGTVYSLTFYLNNGAGAFSGRQDLTSPERLLYVEQADLDRDGKLDLLGASYYGSTIIVFRSSGPGTFNTPVSYAANANPTDLGIGDFNQDGRMDAATSSYTSANYSILLGN